jgi:integrase
MLTHKALVSLVPREKPFKVSDAHGLHIVVLPSGTRSFRWNFRLRSADGKVQQKTLSLGTYPDVTLASARTAAHEARQLLAKGIDPAEARKPPKIEPAVVVPTVEEIAREWFVQKSTHVLGSKDNWSQSHTNKTWSRISAHIIPMWGHLAIDKVTPRILTRDLEAMQARGLVETALRVASIVSLIFRRAVRQELVNGNPAADISEDLRKWEVTHFPSLKGHADIAELMRRIDGYCGVRSVEAALKLAPHVFLRPRNLRYAEWSEIDLDGATWTIVNGKMKNKKPFLIPLSTQAVEMLREQHRHSGSGRYVFPGRNKGTDRVMSDATLNGVLIGLGYERHQLTPHGLRGTASTGLNEMGWNSDWVERQLSHVDRNSIRGAYNSAKYLPARRQMMQAWSDYLSALRAAPVGKYQDAASILVRDQYQINLVPADLDG